MFCQATGFGGTVQQGRTVEAKLAARELTRDEALEAAAAAREVRAGKAAAAARLAAAPRPHQLPAGRAPAVSELRAAAARWPRRMPAAKACVTVLRSADRPGVLPAGVRGAPARQHRPPAGGPLAGVRT
jgi:hypothetical protein